MIRVDIFDIYNIILNMSTDMEGYDATKLAAEAETRWAEHMDVAKLLNKGGAILELVATKLAVRRDSRPGFTDTGEISLDVKELMDIVDERSDPQEAASQISLGAKAVFSARDFQVGIARAAKESADFLDSRSGDDTAAQTDVAAI